VPDATAAGGSTIARKKFSSRPFESSTPNWMRSPARRNGIRNQDSSRWLAAPVPPS
jgi:hypothetical protein